MKKSFRALVLLSVLVLMAGVLPATPAQAAGYDVCPTGCSYSSIQAAVDGAVSGATITVGPGTYAENITVDKYVKITGAGSGLDGTVITTPASFAARVGIFQISGSGPSASEPIVLKDLRIEPKGQAGISVGRFTEATGTLVNNLALVNVFVIGTNNNASSEQERGLYVDLTSTIDHLVVINSAFNNLAYGWYLMKQVSADASTVSNVTVVNTVFNHNNLKGLYAEKLTNATFTACTWSQNGFDAAGLPSYFIPWMSGVDINLKAGSYENITLIDPVITFNALGGAQHGVGIAVKARDDGSTYGPFPATLNNVLIHGGTITGNERGLRIGEPNKNNASPTNVVIEGVTLKDNLKAYTGTDGSAYGDLINYSSAAMDASPNWFGSIEGAASGMIFGDVSYSPWCANDTCTLTLPITEPGTIEIPSGTSGADLQVFMTGVPSGSIIVIPSGVYNFPGGFNLDQPGLTVRMAPGAVIQNDSPCFIVTADNITLEGGICVPTGGSNGIDVADGVDYLIVQGMEIDGATSGGTANGIAFTGDHKNVQILDNYFHDLGGVAIDFGTGAYTEYFEVQGNYLKGEIMARDGSTLDVTYNNWDLPAGPGTLANLTTVPFTYAGVSVAPTTDKMLVGDELTYSIQLDPRKVTGTELDLVYDPAVVSVKSVTCNDGDFDLRCVVDTSTPGVIHFSGVSYTAKDSLTNLYTVVFTGAADGTSALDADETDALFAMFSGGSSTKVYANVFSDGVVTVYAHRTVTGTVQLQGRPGANWVGAQVDFGAGAKGYSYTSTPSVAWGGVTLFRVVDDTYPVSVSRTNYLPVILASGHTFTVSALDTTLNTIQLLAGDVKTDAYNIIDLDDASTIGLQYNLPGSADINGDGMVNVFDLSLMAGNYLKESSTAYNLWIP